MNPANVPPSLQPTTKSANNLRLWAITATAAAVVFGFISLVLLAQIAIKPLPVSVAFRPSFMDSSKGLIALIRNDSAEPLKVLVSLSSPATGKSKEFEIIIPSSQVTEIGWVQGWAFVEGETLKIHNGRFKDATFTVPNIPNK